MQLIVHIPILDNSRWSLGQDVLNTIGTDGGSCDSGIEYYVTLGHDNDHGYEAFDEFRIYKIVDGDIVMDTPMDSTADGTLYVYDGSGWDEVSYSCSTSDAGPCWEAGDENFCCNTDDSYNWADCAQAALNQEGQWSHDNTNQHLRCTYSDSDQDQVYIILKISVIMCQNCYK